MLVLLRAYQRAGPNSNQAVRGPPGRSLGELAAVGGEEDRLHFFHLAASALKSSRKSYYSGLGTEMHDKSQTYSVRWLAGPPRGAALLPCMGVGEPPTL